MTEAHNLYYQALRDKAQMPVVAYGSAGTGKTYTAVEYAVEWLSTKGSRVLVTRPNVSFAEKSGFLPGTEREKMEPWIRPIEQNFNYHGVNKGQLETLEKNHRLIYMPLEFIQGLTWDNTLIIVDECQNMTFDQLKVFLGRTGKHSKVVLCGDIAQVSPKFKGSGLAELIDMVHHFDMPVHTILFEPQDIMRGDQCKMWIEKFEQWEILRHG